MQYMVVVEKGAISSGAYVPDLPGCVATGESRDEMLNLIRERIGTTQSAIARLESAEAKHSPSIATLQKYAKALASDNAFERSEKECGPHRARNELRARRCGMAAVAGRSTRSIRTSPKNQVVCLSCSR
jgi:predicted RNase H-like HicB family nuclease